MPRTASPRSRRGRGWAGAVGMAGLTVVAALSGCATPVPDRPELTEAFERTGMSRAEARCVSDAILDTLTEAQVRAIAERGPSGAPPDPPGRTDGPATKVRTAMTACTATTTTTVVTTVPVTGGSTTTSTLIDGTEGARLTPASTSTTTTTTP